jgi:hypothetical protein
MEDPGAQISLDSLSKIDSLGLTTEVVCAHAGQPERTYQKDTVVQQVPFTLAAAAGHVSKSKPLAFLTSAQVTFPRPGAYTGRSYLSDVMYDPNPQISLDSFPKKDSLGLEAERVNDHARQLERTYQ